MWSMEHPILTFILIIALDVVFYEVVCKILRTIILFKDKEKDGKEKVEKEK